MDVLENVVQSHYIEVMQGGVSSKAIHNWLIHIFFYILNGILVPKLFWPTVRKKISSDREKFLKFEAEGNLQKNWDH